MRKWNRGIRGIIQGSRIIEVIKGYNNEREIILNY